MYAQRKRTNATCGPLWSLLIKIKILNISQSNQNKIQSIGILQHFMLKQYKVL